MQTKISNNLETPLQNFTYKSSKTHCIDKKLSNKVEKLDIHHGRTHSLRDLKVKEESNQHSFKLNRRYSSLNMSNNIDTMSDFFYQSKKKLKSKKAIKDLFLLILKSDNQNFSKLILKKEISEFISTSNAENQAATINPNQNEDPDITICDICLDECSKGYKKKPLNCNHEFCHECYITYLSEKIDKNEVLSIKCPYYDCTKKFEDKDIKNLIQGELLEKYFRFKKNTLLNQNPNLKWCPNQACDKYVVAQDEDSSKLECECGTFICGKCGFPYHDKQTCEEIIADAYKRMEQELEIQLCKLCKTPVEKVTGCNHMTCPRCKYEWCWICEGKYTKNHYSPFNPFGCPRLQDGENTKDKWPLLKRVCFKIGYLLYLLLIILLMPIILFWMAVMVPNTVYKSTMTRKKYSSESRIISKIILTLVGFILLPFTIIYGSFIGINFIIRRYKLKKRREKEEQEDQERIKKEKEEEEREIQKHKEKILVNEKSTDLVLKPHGVNIIVKE